MTRFAPVLLFLPACPFRAARRVFRGLTTMNDAEDIAPLVRPEPGEVGLVEAPRFSS